jgi:hypothetical protein
MWRGLLRGRRRRSRLANGSDLTKMTAQRQLRYVDNGGLLAFYGTAAVVVCPKCGGQAKVQAKSKYAIPFVPTETRLSCSNCSFAIAPNEWRWFGPILGYAKERCSNCGFKWLRHQIRRKSVVGKPQNSVCLACPSCGFVSRISIGWTFPRFGSAVDPVFGLPLWLRTSCRGETLWAYNEEHLTRLRSYVAATLRERTISSRGGMISRLPSWVSAAKNRDAVLSCIDRLERKLQRSGG